MPIFSLTSLALASAWHRRWTLGLMACTLALCVLLLLGMVRLRDDARTQFTQAISGTDLVVGARSGELPLLLNLVFHLGSPRQNMHWASVEKLRTHPAVAWVIPLDFGDSVRGYPLIGSSTDLFVRYRYGDDRRLVLMQGSAWSAEAVRQGRLEAVLGSEVARSLNYHLGDRIVISHGLGDSPFALDDEDHDHEHEDADQHDNEEHDHTRELGGHGHADKPFVVSGILAATGTPVDRAVWVPLEAYTALHLDWQGGAPIPGVSIPTPLLAKFDLNPKAVSGLLLGLKNRADVLRMQREIDEDASEALSAVLPGVALDTLWGLLGAGERVLLVAVALVGAVSLIGLIAVQLAALHERRRELAVLRALGMRLRDVFLLLLCEATAVLLCGIVLGIVFFYLGLVTLSPWLREHYGLWLTLRGLSGGEWIYLLVVLLAGLGAGLAPAWRAYRYALADGLNPA